MYDEVDTAGAVFRSSSGHKNCSSISTGGTEACNDKKDHQSYPLKYVTQYPILVTMHMIMTDGNAWIAPEDDASKKAARNTESAQRASDDLKNTNNANSTILTTLTHTSCHWTWMKSQRTRLTRSCRLTWLQWKGFEIKKMIDQRGMQHRGPDTVGAKYVAEQIARNNEVDTELFARTPLISSFSSRK